MLKVGENGAKFSFVKKHEADEYTGDNYDDDANAILKNPRHHFSSYALFNKLCNGEHE